MTKAGLVAHVPHDPHARLGYLISALRMAYGTVPDAPFVTIVHGDLSATIEELEQSHGK